MKKILALILTAFFGLATTNAETGMYRPDQAAIDQMFAGAVQADFQAESAMVPYAATSGHSYIQSDKNPAVAFILAWAVGYLGIHRAYLGTSTGTIIAYILTLGGCGVVYVIDWVMLLIGLVDDDISKYVDNPSFFMW
ncbi:MAG: TM2 domain-containing protein [Bacteroidales bacterium]